MKYKYLLLICLFLLPYGISAQQVEEYTPADTSHLPMGSSIAVDQPYDSLSAIAYHAMPYELSPSYMPLHQGLNATVGMNLRMAFGKYAPQGVGFGQNLGLTYLHPLNKRLTLAVGLYANHLQWDNYDHTAMGVSAQLAYAVHPRISLSAYAMKRLTNTPTFSYLDYSPFCVDPKERYGVAVDFKISPSFKVGLSCEYNKWDDNLLGGTFHPTPHRYDGLLW